MFDDLRKTLQTMIWALEKDVVDEIQTETAEKSIEERMSSLEMENAEMRSKLVELGNEMKERGL